MQHNLAALMASSTSCRGKSSSRGYQHTALAWQGAQRSHSGSSSQGTKRHADSDAALDPPYKAKRARVSNPPAPKLHPRADANGRTGPAKSEADSGSALGSDLLGSSSGNDHVTHSAARTGMHSSNCLKQFLIKVLPVLTEKLQVWIHEAYAGLECLMLQYAAIVMSCICHNLLCTDLRLLQLV